MDPHERAVIGAFVDWLGGIGPPRIKKYQFYLGRFLGIAAHDSRQGAPQRESCAGGEAAHGEREEGRDTSGTLTLTVRGVARALPAPSELHGFGLARPQGATRGPKKKSR